LVYIKDQTAIENARTGSPLPRFLYALYLDLIPCQLSDVSPWGHARCSTLNFERPWVWLWSTFIVTSLNTYV